MGCWLNSVQQLNTQKHIKIGEILLKHFVLIKVLDEMYQQIFTRKCFFTMTTQLSQPPDKKGF